MSLSYNNVDGKDEIVVVIKISKEMTLRMVMIGTHTHTHKSLLHKSNETTWQKYQNNFLIAVKINQKLAKV